MYVRDIAKRDMFERTDAARWAFFGIFIVVIFLVVLGTVRVNKKRNSNGLQPIFGTRWMTPPSYLQSQTQYEQPTARNYTSDQPRNYVPTYTETANDQDLGYYDANGEFHENPNAKPGYQLDSQNPIVNNPAHQRNSSRDGVVISEIGESDDDLGNFTRPTYPPQTQAQAQTETDASTPTVTSPGPTENTTNTNTNTPTITPNPNTNTNLNQFDPPASPPPSSSNR